MYDAFIQDSAGNPSVGIEYEEYSSSSWVALGLYFTPTQDIRMVDSVCVQLAGDGGIKVEWVQGKGSLSRAPGMFTIVAAQNEWSTHCISKTDFIIDPTTVQNNLTN
jgi:hypothetical protein